MNQIVQASAAFTALVVYAIPAMAELKRRFPRVDPSYDVITFKRIKVCNNVSRETREVEFEYVHLGYDASKNAVLADIKKRGLRPALPEELLAFDAKYPDEMLKHVIVALGSEALVDGERDVAYLWSACGERFLDLLWVGDDWSGSYRFLAVRK